MNKIAFVCDSCIDLPKEYRKDYVFVLPLKVIKDGVEFIDGVNITPEEVVREIATHDFKTSLPSPGEISNILEEVKAKGYKQMLIVNISSGLSGTANAFRVAASGITDVEIECIDTLSIGGGAGVFGIDAIECIEKGMSLKEVADRLRNRIATSKVFFCLDTLEYLIKGGRIGKVTGFVGQMLHLKPVITCDFEGIYATVAKVRGKLNGVNKCIDLIVENFKDYEKVIIGIASCYSDDEMYYIRDQITKRLTNITKLFLTDISPVLTVHTGPGLIGVVGYPL